MWGVPYAGEGSPSASEIAQAEAEAMEEDPDMVAEQELFGGEEGDEGDDWEDAVVEQGMEDAERESQANSPGGDLLDQVVEEGGGIAGPSTGHSDEWRLPWVHRNARAAGDEAGGSAGAGTSGARPPRRIVDVFCNLALARVRVQQ